MIIIFIRFLKYLFNNLSKTLSISIIVLLLCIILPELIRIYAPTKPVYSKDQYSLVLELSEKVADWLNKMDLERGRTFLGNFSRDNYGFVSDKIRDAIWRTDIFDIIDYDIFEKILRALNWSLPTYNNPEQIMKAAQRKKAKYAIGGEILKFTDTNKEKSLYVVVYLIDVNKNVMLGKEYFEVKNNMVFPVMKAKYFMNIPITIKLFIWLVISGLLPFSTLIICKSTLKYGSWQYILIILLLLTGISGALCYYFVSTSLDKFWTGFLLMFLVPLSAYYNFKALEFCRNHVQ